MLQFGIKFSKISLRDDQSTTAAILSEKAEDNNSFKGARSRYFGPFQEISALIKIVIQLTKISK